MTDSSIPSVIKVNKPNNLPIQRQRINFDKYLDKELTKTSVEKSSNNKPDIGGINRDDDIDIPATVERENEIDKGEVRVVEEEEEVVNNYHLRSSRYDEYSSSSSESSDSNSDSNSNSDYREWMMKMILSELQ